MSLSPSYVEASPTTPCRKSLSPPPALKHQNPLSEVSLSPPSEFPSPPLPESAAARPQLQPPFSHCYCRRSPLQKQQAKCFLRYNAYPQELKSSNLPILFRSNNYEGIN